MMNNKISILILDDDVEMLVVLQRVLESAGFAVNLQTRGAAALREIGRHERWFDLVITDINMPGVNGWELLKTLHEQFPKLPVMVMTAEHNNGSFYLQAIQKGAAAFLSKPFSRVDALSNVRRILAKETPLPTARN